MRADAEREAQRERLARDRPAQDAAPVVHPAGRFFPVKRRGGREREPRLRACSARETAPEHGAAGVLFLHAKPPEGRMAVKVRLPCERRVQHEGELAMKLLPRCEREREEHARLLL